MTEMEISRKQREEKERQKYIMKAAERLIAQKGYVKTSVSDIAQEAEFGVGTLYKYFKDKETLFHSLIDWRTRELFDMLHELLQANDMPTRIISNYIDSYIAYTTRRKEFFNIFITYVYPRLNVKDADHEEFPELIIQRERFFTALISVIQRGMQRGEFRAIDPVFFAGALFGLVFSMFHTARVKYGDDPWDVETMKTTAKSLIFNNMLLTGHSDRKP